MNCITTSFWKMGIRCMMLALCFAVGLTGCSESDDDMAAPYDPTQPVKITDFTPKSGGGKMKMVIYGKNFGTDKSLVRVTIGGKEALLINVKNNALYCQTPDRCFEGTIEVTVGDQQAVSFDKYEYEPQMVVSDLCGEVDELGKGDVISEPRPFDDCGKIEKPFWFSFDPLHPHILYLTQANKTIRVLDLKNEMIYSKFVDVDTDSRLWTITWTQTDYDHDGEIERDMIISTPQNKSADKRGNIIIPRAPVQPDGLEYLNDTGYKMMTRIQTCQTVAIHPDTGELFFNSNNLGVIYKYDFTTNGVGMNNLITSNQSEYYSCSLQKASQMRIVFHPTGDYAYLIMQEASYILRANYDRTTNRLVTPYIIAGKQGEAAWVDDVGTAARFSNPFQGVFVKNEEYVAAGKADHYDFYITDRTNHCIRCLTPDGVVTTFAGRGIAGSASSVSGKTNGEVRNQARFNQPTAIAYDESTKTFYVGEQNNYKIRKIAREVEDDVTDENLPSDDEGTTEEDGQ